MFAGFTKTIDRIYRFSFIIHLIPISNRGILIINMEEAIGNFQL